MMEVENVGRSWRRGINIEHYGSSVGTSGQCLLYYSSSSSPSYHFVNNKVTVSSSLSSYYVRIISRGLR